MITAHTSRVGLISWPVGHSLSPVMQNAAFAHLNLDWVYLPLPVQPGHLEEAIRGLVALNFAGCNISVPHKTNVIPFLDEITPAVAQMKAANTIKIVDGKVYGSNTDPDGFIGALRSADFPPEGTRILVIGAGGAARAALYGLSQVKGVQVHVLDVIEQQATNLVQDMQALFGEGALNCLPYKSQSFETLRRQVDLVVNASPVGMHPKVAASPWPDEIDLPDQAAFFDMVYNPLETRFLSRAARAGRRTISGLMMLVKQGAVSFETWTNQPAPMDVMLAACNQVVGESK